MMIETLTLYKPLTPIQLAAVIESGWRSFSLDHPSQKNFYLKVNKNYADLVAKMWSAPKYSAGYVAELEIEQHFIEQYELQSIAYDDQSEYRIPVEDLNKLNQHIIGLIDVISAFHFDIFQHNNTFIEQNTWSFH